MTSPIPPDPEDAPPPASGVEEGAGFSLGFLDATVVAGGSADAIPKMGTPPPASAGPYVLKHRIGEGGQGEVWEAWQTSLGREVAVKIHRRGSAESFLKEAILTGELDHPNIVPVLDLGTLHRSGLSPHGERPVMAMKRVTGERWDVLIARERPAEVPPAEAYWSKHLGILRSVCLAVAYAHARGIVHLDLKPSQVIAGGFGEVFLMDWGIAARLDGNRERGRCVADIDRPLGTPGYMAPEQALADAAAIGVATDVYLLGATAFHIATGQPPHPGDSPTQSMDAARQNRRRPLGPDIPAPLRRLIDRALSTAPPARFASAEEFRLAIEDFLGGMRQTQEAKRLLAECSERFTAVPASGYAELAAIEGDLDRARALDPEIEGLMALRDDVLAAHSTRAIAAGDLELAGLIAHRIAQDERREALLAALREAQDQRAARERERVRARRYALVALASLLAVAAVASVVLFIAFETAVAERRNTERALDQAQRELARASLQAAQSHIENQRFAAARDALRQTPQARRGWEWGYLASAAMPEERLLRPRDERYATFALSEAGGIIGAIGADDGRLAILDAATGEVLTEDAGAWTAVMAGPGETVLAASGTGYLAAFGPKAPAWKVRVAQEPLLRLAGSGEAPFAASERAVYAVPHDSSAIREILRTDSPITALGAQGDLFAAGTQDGRIFQGHAESSEVLESPNRHDAPVRGIAWAPDGARFVTWAVEPGIQQAARDPRAIIHHAGGAAPEIVLTPDEFAVTAAAWREDGTLLLTTASTTIRLYDPATWEVARRFTHPAGIVNELVLSPGGAFLYTRTRNAIERIDWRMDWERVPIGVDSRAVAAFALAGEGFLACGADGGLAYWAPGQPAHQVALPRYPDRIFGLDVASAAPVLATAHQSGVAGLWDMTGGVPGQPRQFWVESKSIDVKVSADGRTALVLRRDGAAVHCRTFPARTESVVTWRTDSPFTATELSADGLALLFATEDGRLLRGDAFEPNVYNELARTKGRWTALALDGSGARLLAGAEDGTITLLDVESSEPMRLFEGHSGPIRDLVWVAKERRFLSASADETARLWNISNPESVTVYRGTHAGAVNAAVLTPDGARVLTACADSLLRVFEADTGVELLTFADHRYGVLDLALMADGRTLITAGQDAVLRTWLAVPWDRGEGFFTEGLKGDRRP
ncbi:MAG: serine/threonine-protein kinase [Sumerlaeia bacterium]